MATQLNWSLLMKEVFFYLFLIYFNKDSKSDQKHLARKKSLLSLTIGSQQMIPGFISNMSKPETWANYQTTKRKVLVNIQSPFLSSTGQANQPLRLPFSWELNSHQLDNNCHSNSRSSKLLRRISKFWWKANRVQRVWKMPNSALSYQAKSTHIILASWD